jgi:glycogen operon protein
MVGRFASRICGSSDLYHGSGKGPECSINFITCHDGFTLNDLVSYERKHNEANGEHNRDGVDENHSANYGVEGESADPALDALRARQIKNFLLTLALSRGVPMLLGGAEFRRTQRGTNNPHCQDNETSWVDWSLRQRHDEIVRFTRSVLALRRAHPVLHRGAFYRDEDIRWFDPGGRSPEWLDGGQRRLACLIRAEDGADLYLMFNADTEPSPFVLPPPSRPREWRVAVDTGQPAPRDAYAVGEESRLPDGTCHELAARSSVVLVSRHR